VTGRHGRRLVQESQERGVGNTVKMAKMRDGSNDVFNIVEDTFFFFFFWVLFFFYLLNVSGRSSLMKKIRVSQIHFLIPRMRTRRNKSSSRRKPEVQIGTGGLISFMLSFFLFAYFVV